MDLSSWIGALEGDSLATWAEGDRVFHRAWRVNGDGTRTSVLALLPASVHPTRASLDRLAHEFGVKADLDSAWALRPLELIRDAGRAVLVFEDPGGEPLDRLLGAPLEPGEFLRLAIAIATALGMAHQRGLIHKDIKPSNIFVNRMTAEVRLTGFGIASRLPRERQSPEPPEFIAGTLAYMPPEQTGRMNRSIDSRSDLYSLGVTMYEMLTGGLPFSARDPMEWVHCHIARQPVPPADHTKDVPAAISAIVMKLLSKTAEDRYQTAEGLLFDLRRCLTEWEAARRIGLFPLGSRDTTQQLLIPEKLYGRDAEIRTLLDAFERVVAQAEPELVLVSGYSGIGKSSVVNELHKVIVLPRGIFISGKFDLRLRDIPYATLAQAFQGLIRQILNGQEADIAHWRDAIQQAVGKHGCLLTDLIPELTGLIGPQPPVPVLSPLETQLRFQSVFQNFVGVFAKAEHPLVIFVDDLQWLDPATLTVVEYLITHPDTHHLLLIGAYRDNEVGPDHPLVGTLSAIRRAGTAVHEIVLGPLSADDFSHLLCDALRSPRAEVEPLAALIHRKAGGNPFFAGQFLTNLVEEGLLKFEPTSGTWRWDLADIDAKGFTDNVVDLMVRRLQRLSPAAQEALKVLACLGSQAGFGTLTKMWGGSEAQMHADFGDAVRAGAILSMARSFKFLHDRVQEAAYALIAPPCRAEHHLRVGRLLLSTMGDHEIAQRIFDVVNQLNLGAPLIADRLEQQRTAALNLQAARKAKASTAYSSACSYLAAAVSMLGEAGWRDGYSLAFSVWFERAECAFLDSNFAEAARWIDELSARAQSKIDRAETYRLRMVLQLVHGENAQAVRTALECLEMFGIELQERPTAEQVRSEYDAVWARLGERGIASLVDLPAMEVPEMRAVMNVLSTLWRSAYFTDSNLCQTIACRMVNVTQQYGTTESAVIGYALLAIFLGPFFGRYDDGEAFARLSVAVAEKHGFAAQKVGANFLMQMALLWTQPIERALKCVDAAIVSAQETGEIVYACYSLEHRLTDLLARGDHLDELWLESVKALEFVERIRFRHVRDILASIQPFIQRLRGHDDDPAVVEEAAVEARLLEAGIAVVACFYWILQLQRNFLLGDLEEALDCAEKAKPLLWSARCHIQYANYCLYESLALAAVHGAASDDRRSGIRAEIAAHVEALQRWADSCPVTFAHKHLLVSAELARLDGFDTQALRLYEQAARLAHEQGFVQEEALANELAARCCLQGGLERAAQAYLREARDHYYRWGALGKVAQLDRRYPSNKPPETSPVLSGTIEEAAERLDIATIVRTSQAISGEMVLENLIKSLMVIASENAGAERGLLILPHGTEQRIEAEATVEGRNVVVALPQRRASSAALPVSVLHYVTSTRESVILDDASVGNRFAADPYIRQRRVRSMLCLPLLKQAKLIGVLYLENNLAPSVFVPARIAVLKLLASQAAIALENARLYQELAGREARIRRLVDANIIGIMVWKANGGILEANDAFLRIVGYEREDLVSGRIRWTDLTPPEWRERTELASVEVSKVGYVPPEEKAYLRKDGSRVPIMIGRVAFETGGDEGVAFVIDLTDRKEAEQRLRESYEMLRELTSRRETAREEERKHIARELHDQLGQYLTALRMRASALRMRFGNEHPALLEDTRALIGVVDETIQVTRGVITSLRPPALDTGIVAALEWLANEFNRHGGTVCRLRVRDENIGMSEERAIVLFRLVQEALTNVARHAVATEVIITLEWTPDACMLEVRDDGQGFDAQAIRRTSFGLAGMEERVMMLGGRIEVVSSPGKGTAIKVNLPGPG
ncbi:AAA family ATPase [Trinickia terrae]|uniref:AAA family ATPase n=1 Tax=Trinickia terrae TaxID=2571161 RepID=UPI001F105D4C|nr:AAA family ATPase [Trinickia terrae]